MQSIRNKLKRMSQNKTIVRARTVSLFVVMTAALLPMSSGVMAQPFTDTEKDARAESFFSQPAGISRKEAARRARAATDGKVIAIKPVKKGNDGYNVRLVVEGGRVVTVRVDGSGKVHR